MTKANDGLQWCVGVSFCFISFGGMWSMIRGANVRVSVAGANLSVNEKLQEVKEIKDKVGSAVEQLKAEPSVSRIKIRAIEHELEEAESKINDTDARIEGDLEGLTEEDIF